MARPRKSAAAPTKPRTTKPTDAELVDSALGPLPSSDPPIADKEPNKGGRPSNTQKLAKQVGEMTALVGMAVATINVRDGMVIASNAVEFGDALAKLAEVNPKLRKLLEGTVNGSAWAGVLVVTGKIALGIAANHGVSVPSPFGAKQAPAESAEQASTSAAA